MDEGIALATFTNITDGLSESFDFVSSSIDSFIGAIVGEELLLWPVIFALATGVVGLVIKIIRKFGFKGRR